MGEPPRSQPSGTAVVEARSEQPLLCVARLDRAGGVDTLLTAFGLLAGDRRSLHLEVVGDGPLGDLLSDLAEALGLDDRVRFHGSLPWEHLGGVLPHCAALVLPHEDDGPMPVEVREALRQALALGHPMVVTDRVVPPDVVCRTPDSFVVPPRNATVLALALADLLGPPN